MVNADSMQGKQSLAWIVQEVESRRRELGKSYTTLADATGMKTMTCWGILHASPGIDLEALSVLLKALGLRVTIVNAGSTIAQLQTIIAQRMKSLGISSNDIHRQCRMNEKIVNRFMGATGSGDFNTLPRLLQIMDVLGIGISIDIDVNGSPIVPKRKKLAISTESGADPLLTSLRSRLGRNEGKFHYADIARIHGTTRENIRQYFNKPHLQILSELRKHLGMSSTDLVVMAKEVYPTVDGSSASLTEIMGPVLNGADQALHEHIAIFIHNNERMYTLLSSCLNAVGLDLVLVANSDLDPCDGKRIPVQLKDAILHLSGKKHMDAYERTALHWMDMMSKALHAQIRIINEPLPILQTIAGLQYDIECIARESDLSLSDSATLTHLLNDILKIEPFISTTASKMCRLIFCR